MRIRGLLVCAAVFAAPGCKQNKDVPKAEPSKAVDYFRVDLATVGTLHGRILYRGPKPTLHAINMDSDPGCRQANRGRPVYDSSLVVGRNGGLANAFVYIQSGLEGKTFEPLAGSVTLGQHGCMYVPRILGLRAGQTLDVRNSDAVSHNIHPVPQNNREWSQQQSPGAPDLEHRFPRPEVMIPVKCNVHSWMRAYIGVMAHPYFAVTQPDGDFELRDVPPGDYTLAVWHETLGSRAKPVHLAASSSATVDFTFEKGR